MKLKILAMGKWAQRVLETCTRSHSWKLKEFELGPMGSDFKTPCSWAILAASVIKPLLGEALAILFLTGSMKKACRAVVSTLAAH